MRKSILVMGFFFVVLAGCEPKSPKPEWEVRYEKARAEADAAFAANNVARAAELFRTAGEALPANDSRKAECAQKLATCQFLDSKERATQLLSEGKRDEAILAIEAARKALPQGDARIPEVDRLIQTFKYQGMLKAGQEKMVKKNWLDAAKDFEAASGLAPGREGEEARDLRGFCGQFAEADEAFLVKQDHLKARPIYEGLLKNPHGFEKDISDRLQSVREAIRKAEEAAGSEKERQFKETLAKGKAHLAKAEWSQAKEVFQAAKAFGIPSPELDALLKIALSAASPPEGFVYVPLGKFTFGAGTAEAVTGPEQEVSTSAFYISKREVTNGDYKKFLESYKDHSKCPESEPAEKKTKGHTPEGWKDSLDPQAPVTSVDWFDAWAYARWAGGKLPSEIEWEKAAGWNPVTGKKSLYPWGDEYTAGNGGPSPCGAEAMGSGVLEWVEDWYLKYPGGKGNDLDFGQTRRVARGGMFLKDDAKEDTKVTRRFRFLPDRQDSHLGFRILKSIE